MSLLTRPAPVATLFPTPLRRPATYGRDPVAYRFTVEQFQRMIETGVLAANEQVELLEGHLVPRMPPNPPHDGTIDLVDAVLGPLLPSGWIRRVQSALVLADSQPQPDVAVVRGTPRSFVARHPTPADTALVIEVADSTLATDRHDKSAIYAANRIPVYWIVNIPDRRVEVYEQPSGPGAAPRYAVETEYHSGESIPVWIDGVEVGVIAVDDVLP